MRTVNDACPEKIGKCLIQITKPLPLDRAIRHAQKTPDTKLFKLTATKYIAIRAVKPDDNIKAIGLVPGRWEEELLEVKQALQVIAGQKRKNRKY